MDMPYKPWHFFAGTKTRMVAGLKSMVFGDANKTEVKAGTDDPTSVAQDMPAGSIYYDITNKRALQKMDAGLTTNFRLMRDDEFTKEPTGFLDPDGTIVTYSVTNRTITLSHASGFVQFLMRGRLFVKTSPWTVCTTIDGATPIAHTNANGSYFLSIDPDTLTVSFGTSAWTFDKLQIALAFKNATAQFALRECHGLMPWQSHQENHSVNGTFLRSAITMTSGTAFTATTSSTATTASNCPGIEAGTIYDEDIPTLNAAWPEASYTVDTYNSGVYTTCYIGAAGAAVFNTAAQLPYLRAGGGVGILQYAPVTSGSGTLTNVTEDSFMNVLVLSLPVTADSDSQKFRTVFMTGQQQFTTLTAAQLQDPASWFFGELASSVPEYVAIQMYSYQYNAAGGTSTPTTVLGRAFLAALPVTFTGSRARLTGFTGVAPSDHQTLSNRSATDAHPDTSITATGTYSGFLSGVTTVGGALTLLDAYATGSVAGVVSTAAQTFAGTKTFNNGIVIASGQNVTSAAASNLLLNAPTGQNVQLTVAGVAVVTASGTAVTLAQATTIGALTTATNHIVQGTGDTSFTGWNSQFLVRDGAAGSAATNGGVISFGGSYDSGNNQTIFALIKGYKENGTSGNFQGGFKIGVRSGSGATLNTAIDCASTGAVTIGSTTATTTTHTLQCLVNADVGGYGFRMRNYTTTAGKSLGLITIAGTNSSDSCQVWVAADNSTVLGKVAGDSVWTIGNTAKIGSNDYTGNLIVGATDGVNQATGYVGESIFDSGTAIITGGSGSYSASTDCAVTVTAGIWYFVAVCHGYRGSTGGTGSVNGTFALVDDAGGVVASTTMPLLAAGSNAAGTLVIQGVQAYSATKTVRVACQYGTTGSPTGAFADIRPDINAGCSTTVQAIRIA